MIFFFHLFWISELPLLFCLEKTMTALVNNILQYSHLVTFLGQFFVTSRCTKWYKLISVRNGSSATSSFPWYQCLFDFSSTQSPVSPTFCNLSGVTLSLAGTTLGSWNSSASSWLLIVSTWGAFKPLLDGILYVSVLGGVNQRNFPIWSCFIS